MTQAAVLEQDWKATAREELEALARTGATFNADTLRERGVQEPAHPNQWGALFGAAHKRGLITKADYSSSQRKSRHGGFLHAWKGVARASV